MKKIFTILLTFTLLFFIVAVTLRFEVVENISKTLIKERLSKYIVSCVKNEFSDIDLDSLNKITNEILNEKELENISTYIFNMLILDIRKGTTSEINLVDRVEKLINKKRDSIPLKYHNQLNDLIDSLDFNKIYIDILEYVRYKFGSKLSSYIKIYDDITNNNIIILLAILIVLCLFVTGWKSKSILDFIHDIGMILLIDGGIMMIIMFIFKRLLSILAALLSVKIDLNMFTIINIIFLVLGFILIDVKTKKYKK